MIIKKDMLILGESPAKGLEDITVTAEAENTNNFIQSGKRLVLSLRYNGSSSYSFVNAIKIYQFKAKD